MVLNTQPTSPRLEKRSCRVSLGSESRIYEIGNPRFLDWNETPLVSFTCSGCGLGVVHCVHSVKFSHISPSDYQQCLCYRIQLRKVLLSCRKRTQLDIQTEVFYLPNHTQPPCSFNLETLDAVCLPQFPTRNYDFRLPGDEISHWETRKYDFPSPKKRGISEIPTSGHFARSYTIV